MNFLAVVRQLGLVLMILSASMVFPLALEVFPILGEATQSRPALYALCIAMAVGITIGAVGYTFGRGLSIETFTRRDAMLLTALTWVFGAGLAAIPYRAWTAIGGAAGAHPFDSFEASYFEAMSGLTTTGATVLGDIQALPASLLLWRSITHWLGGLGIVVLFVAVLPNIGSGGRKLFFAEAPGPQQQGVRPRIGETARMLWLLYLGLTIAAMLAFWSTGAMGLFDSICHAFSVMSTGGLSTRDASIGHYNSLALDLWTMLFMLLAGVNFAIFYLLLQRRWSILWTDTELRFYLILKLAATTVISLELYGTAIVTTAGHVVQATFGDSLRYAAFQVIALQTGTGFCTADFELWPIASKTFLFSMFLIGGCAGSTAGGIKVIRVWIAIKILGEAIERAYRPAVVRPLRLGNTIVDDDMKLGTLIYTVLFFLLLGVGTGVLVITESSPQCDLLTAASATVSTLCNVGPGFHAVGPTQNYGWFSDPSLIVLSVLMALGRLEIYALLALAWPRFWMRD
ncbi:TrkH family potassium uptake protein [Mucisphaera calidilacus]|uniref:Trk system potassium uptake protein TrkG n=1 Tax=Mucisphaera calidilacus TaxID=2527982 RepID=A0A518BZ10_9BACT|nr:TrkH family potassium uptake protein [Mucisphaera calidilacus]QDU72206.1 Trk system potassium uptake protein TrkG [Mucisphaera calidilacus]